MTTRIPDGPCECCKAVSAKRRLLPFGKTKRLAWLCKTCRCDILAGRCPARKIKETNRRLLEAVASLASAGVRAGAAARGLELAMDGLPAHD